MIPPGEEKDGGKKKAGKVREKKTENKKKRAKSSCVYREPRRIGTQHCVMDPKHETAKVALETAGVGPRPALQRRREGGGLAAAAQREDVLMSRFIAVQHDRPSRQPKR